MNFTLTVISVISETLNTKTIVFKQPRLKKIKYQAGQYVTLVLNIQGRRYLRAYSFSSAPSVDFNLEITVKRKRGGIVSNYICDNFKVGDLIEVIEPMGKFIFDYKANVNTIFLWGVGSGITPLFSLLKEILHTSPNASIVLAYGNQNLESTIFYKQIETFANSYTKNLRVYNFISRDESVKESDFLKKGRISKQFIMEVLNIDFSDFNSAHFVCGPTDFISSVKDVLLEKGVSDSRINFERFENTINSEELTEVKSCQASIVFKGCETLVFIPRGKTILESALDNKIGIPYFCQIGDCEKCKGKLITGDLKTIGLNHVKNTLGEKEFFSCCSYPLTESIKVEFV